MLAELATQINLGIKTDKLISYILSQIVEILEVESATLFYLDDTKRALIPKVVRGPKSLELEEAFKKLKIMIGQGIVGWSAQLGKPVIVNDPYSHPKFSKEFDIMTGYVTRNILCVPLEVKKKLRGIIEAVNKKGNEDGGFTEADSALLHTASALMVLAIENEETVESLRKTSHFYETIIENMSGGFISVGNDMKIINFNPSAQNIIGISKTTVVGKNFKEVLTSYPAICKILAETLSQKKTVARQETEFSKMSGETIRIGYTTILINDKSGEQLGCSMIFQRLTV
ncbi:MAG: GAF domain-containing protein [Elusimicrobiota bacterium]